MSSLTIAAVYENMTYEIVGDSVTVTGYPDENNPPAGALFIPASIEGKPVTVIAAGAFLACTELTSVSIPASVVSIGSSAFYSCSDLTAVTISPGLASLSIGGFAFYACSNLTSLTIPARVTSIGTDAVANCSSLTSITVDEANLNYSSAGGVLFNEAKTILVAYPGGAGGGVSIPATVTSIGANAFVNCDKLTGVTIPSSVLSIGNGAFQLCNLLQHATFTGNAPTLGTNAFIQAASGFKIYHYATATGFDVSPWPGYTKVVMGAPTAITDWLLSQGLNYFSNLKSDTDGDGVSLLMAYALNLDPDLNLSGSLPQPVFAAGAMSLKYHSTAAGITYTAQVSPNLLTWSSEGVSISGPDGEGKRTATSTMTGGNRFMRLKVTN